MFRLKIAMVVICLIGFGPPVNYADKIYTWKDDKGQWHISQTPPPPDARSIDRINYTPHPDRQANPVENLPESPDPGSNIENYDPPATPVPRDPEIEGGAPPEKVYIYEPRIEPSLHENIENRHKEAKPELDKADDPAGKTHRQGSEESRDFHRRRHTHR